jgi:hypothetical protein
LSGLAIRYFLSRAKRNALKRCCFNASLISASRLWLRLNTLCNGTPIRIRHNSPSFLIEQSKHGDERQHSQVLRFLVLLRPPLNSPKIRRAPRGRGRAKAQQQQLQHMTDYYARTTREQEERENREARERFADQRRR